MLHGYITQLTKYSMSIISIGIDVSKDTLDVVFLSENKQQSHVVVSNSDTGITSLLKQIHTHGTAQTVPCVLESTGMYHLRVACMLANAGYTVNCINPIITKQYQYASIRGAKTDRVDAGRLAHVGISEPDLPVFVPNTDNLYAKRLITQLAGIEKTMQSLKLARSNLVATARILSTTPDVSHLDDAIASLKKQAECIQSILCLHAPSQAKKIAEKLPGVTHASMAVLLTAFADKSFSNRDQLVAFVGLDVRPRQSGKFTGKGKLSKRGNAYLRKVLYRIAWGLKQHHPFYQLQYEALREKGKDYTTSLLIIARRFTRLLFAVVWQNKSLFT